MKSKGTLRGIFNVTESGVARRWRGAERFCIKANVLFCAPKENQKSARYFRGAGGTNQGLLALDNPGGVVETEKS